MPNLGTFFILKEGVNMKKIVAILIVVGILMGGYIGFNRYIESSQSPVDSQSMESITVEVPGGYGTAQIASLLSEKGLIKDQRVFRYISKLEKKDSSFKAGIYTLSKSMDMGEILHNLTKGGMDIGVEVFTIPEGYEIRQIADLLNEKGLVDRDAFVKLASDADRYREDYGFLDSVPQGKGLEGYLYPNTYQIDESLENKEETIIKMMLDNFDKYYTEELRAKADSYGMDTNQVITLASIIEREAQVESERATVSAVFHNRIADGMKLQSCATVQYILEERKAVLSYDDIAIESPYNTYLYSGLPPAPIASPGIASIEASLNPEDVDYLFFVANGDGSHTFSVTYEEHLEAQNKNQN